MSLQFDWVKPTRGRGSTGGAKTDGVSIRSSVYKGAGGEPSPQTTIRLGLDVMKHCRFLVGDRVCIGTAIEDSKVYLAVRRDTTGQGYTLSNHKGLKAHGSAKDYGIVKIKTPSAHGLAACDISLAECVMDENGTLIIPLGA
jgi:hypothetical protein